MNSLLRYRCSKIEHVVPLFAFSRIGRWKLTSEVWNPNRDEDVGAPNRGEVGFGRPGLAGEVHRVMQRFLGHANVVTDIKEATFLGGDDKLVAVCSDDGHVFMYNADTGSPVRHRIVVF